MTTDSQDDDIIRFEQWLRQVLARADRQWLLALVFGPAQHIPVAGAVTLRPGSLLAQACTAHAVEYRRHVKEGRKLRVLAMPDGRLMPLDPSTRHRRCR